MSPDDLQQGVSGETAVELYGPEDGGWFTTRVHDWIALCPFLRDPDVRAYLVLRALVIEKYKNPVRKLTMADLCELIPGPNGKSSSLTRVRGMLAGLSGVGLVSTPEGGVVKTSSRAGAAQRAMRIRINDMPSEGYAGWRNAEAKLQYIAKVAAEREAGRNSDPGVSGDAPGEDAGRNSDPAGLNSDPGGSNSDPDPGSEQPERDVPLVPSVGTEPVGDAPSGRSPVDGRSPSPAGSSRDGVEGGFAASGKTAPSPTQHDDTRRPAAGKKGGSKKAGHSREQLDMVRRVRAFFPPELLSAEGGLPDVPTLTAAVLAGMAEGRTVEQMRDRIWYRWANHGFADIWAEERRFDRPVGVAVALVRPLRKGDRFACPDLRCENGADIETKVPCRLCVERIADWRADRARERASRPPAAAKATSANLGAPAGLMPPQRAAQGPRSPLMAKCAEEPCQTLVQPGGEPLCPDCLTAAEDAARAQIARWEAEAAAAQIAVEPELVDVEAEETARIRAELAAQYGTPEEVAAYCNPAPF